MADCRSRRRVGRRGATDRAERRRQRSIRRARRRPSGDHRLRLLHPPPRASAPFWLPRPRSGRCRCRPEHRSRRSGRSRCRAAGAQLPAGTPHRHNSDRRSAEVRHRLPRGPDRRGFPPPNPACSEPRAAGDARRREATGGVRRDRSASTPRGRRADPANRHRRAAEAGSKELRRQGPARMQTHAPRHRAIDGARLPGSWGTPGVTWTQCRCEDPTR